MDENGLKENDPYRGMETAEKDIRPDYLSSTDKEKERAARAKRAAAKLGGAEKEAVGAELGQKADNLIGARQAESKTGGFYSGSGKSIKGVKDLKKLAFKGRFTKKGPIVGIFLAIFVFGGITVSTQVFQPFSLVAQFMETFNSMHTSANRRTSRFFKAQMETGRTKSPFNKGIKLFGVDFKISEKQQEKLKQQGIEYDETTFKNSKGQGIKVLKYKLDDGKTQIVAADAKTAKTLTEMVLSKYNTDEVKYSTEATDFKNFYATDTGFFHAYNAGSVTWRGAVANWFGTNTANFLRNNKLTRNMFQDYEKKVQEADGDTKKATKDILDEKTKTVEFGGDKVTNEKETETTTDEDGNTTSRSRLKHPGVEGAGSTSRADLTEDNIKSRLNTISGRYSGSANIGCALTSVLGAINMMVQAAEMVQILNLTTALFETVDKTKYGLGEEAPIHDFSDALNEKMDNVHAVIDGDGGGKVTDSGIGGMDIKETSTSKTAMEAAGVAALYSGGKVNPHDPSVESFNLEASSKKIFGGLGLTMSDFKTCLAARAGEAAVSAVAEGVSIASCIAGVAGAAFTFGISAGACGPLFYEKLKDVIVGIGVSLAISGVIALITPKVVSMMTRDLITNMGGEDFGNAVTSGANIYQGRAHRASGGSPATAEKYQQFAVVQQQVIAEEAKDERTSLSPFDITSKNTFLGSFLTQLMSLTSSSNLMSIVTAGGNSLSSSLVALNSTTASAYNVAESLYSQEEYEGFCPYTASVDAVGDAFCNEYDMTDMSTMDEDPATVIDKVYEYGGLKDEATSDGNIVIDGDSDFAKYIRYCDNRTSSFGIADQNIADDIGSTGMVDTGSSGFNSAANGAIGSTVVGDVFELIDDEKQLANIGYISGSSCVAGNKVSAAESPSWSKGKWYQRLIEDQSLAESMGIIEKSAVAVYLEEYYKENPLDNSYEGILARYSGLRKDTVVALLDIVDYYDYVANYDPSEVYAFGSDLLVENEGETDLNFGQENILAGEVTLVGNVVYRDVRNRVFTV